MTKPGQTSFPSWGLGGCCDYKNNDNILWKIRADNVTGPHKPLTSIKRKFSGSRTLLSPPPSFHHHIACCWWWFFFKSLLLHLFVFVYGLHITTNRCPCLSIPPIKIFHRGWVEPLRSMKYLWVKETDGPCVSSPESGALFCTEKVKEWKYGCKNHPYEWEVGSYQNRVAGWWASKDVYTEHQSWKDLQKHISHQ